MEFDLNEEPNDSSNNDNKTVVEPAVGMTFDSGLEYAEFCHTYACKTGFQFHIRTCALLDEFQGKGYGLKILGEEPQYEMLKRLRLTV